MTFEPVAFDSVRPIDRRKHRKLPDDRTLAELYITKRLTHRQIAELYDVALSTVYQRLAAIGIRPIRRKFQLDAEILRILYVEQRLSQKAIGAKLGLSKSWIGEQIRRHGITRDREMYAIKKS